MRREGGSRPSCSYVSFCVSGSTHSELPSQFPIHIFLPTRQCCHVLAELVKQTIFKNVHFYPPPGPRLFLSSSVLSSRFPYPGLLSTQRCFPGSCLYPSSVRLSRQRGCDNRRWEEVYIPHRLILLASATGRLPTSYPAVFFHFSSSSSFSASPVLHHIRWIVLIFLLRSPQLGFFLYSLFFSKFLDRLRITTALKRRDPEVRALPSSRGPARFNPQGYSRIRTESAVFPTTYTSRHPIHLNPMYIPLHLSPAEIPPGPLLPRPLARPLQKREFTGDASRDTNIKIGIIVAVVLTTFIVGVGYFLYRYRASIRFTHRKRRSRRRKSTGSSRSGRSAAGEEPPAPPAPPAGPPTEPPPK